MKSRFSSIAAIVLLVAVSIGAAGGVSTVHAASACNAAAFVADVTIPDGTYEDPGEVFVKTWRLKNVGTCTWNTSYGLFFDSGSQMSGPDLVLMPQYVSPGQAVDVSVTLTAPTSAGIYRGYWKLRSPSGQVFGIGSGFYSAFWVEIRVLTPLQGTVAYDFVSEVCSGLWIYDGGPIPCPKNPNKLQYGHVEVLDNPLTETGAPAGAASLLTIPQQKYNGLIRGLFNVDDIFRGDHFQATIGCKYGATNCYVTYALEYEKGGNIVTIWKFRERYDGLLAPVDIDLSRFADMRNTRLVLTVMASGPAAPDEPLWIAPRIVRTISQQVATPTFTPAVPTLTPTPITQPYCNRAQFISDLTVPDGTTFAPNATFNKVWRLKNVGNCAWGAGYSLTFVSGDRMGGVDTLLPQTVYPGQTVDAGVNLTAPSIAGSYRGYWELKDPTNGVFGIGSNYDKPWWVDIKVSGTSTGSNTALDFVNSACSATWASGAGVLPCPGTEGDSRGFVLMQSNPKLENGTTSTVPGILTYPQDSTNGYIQGTYPAFTVQSGDRFQGTLDCEYAATSCFVIFRLDYRVDAGPQQTLGTFGEIYDGLYYPADIDLSSLAGKNVSFILTVLANGAATGDRAQWVGAKIVRNSAVGGSSYQVPAPTDAAPTATETVPVAADTPTETETPVPDTATPTAEATETSATTTGP
jgi:hypothetical protein